MGFYIRKAIKVGPFRFNLSKSGIGVSAGIKGLRLGVGPRGNYVHMGRGGLYFRKSLDPPHTRTPKSPSAKTKPFPDDTHRDELDRTVGPFEEIDSGSVLEMVDASSRELLHELNEKRKKIRIFPIAAIAALIGMLMMLGNNAPTWLLVLVVAVAIGGCWLAWMKDELRKTTVIFYDLHDEVELGYEQMHDSFGQLKSCARAWHIEARAVVRDRKYHAGADVTTKRKLTSLSFGSPPFVKTNVKVPLVPVGRQVLAFMPDRLLVFDTNLVGAVSYKDLTVEVEEGRFIEDESVPRDAAVVGKTWRYVNKKGGPDRRFKDNREIPICAYEHVHFSSGSGLNEVIVVSRRGAGEKLTKALAFVRELRTAETRAPAVYLA